MKSGIIKLREKNDENLTPKRRERCHRKISGFSNYK